MGAAPGMSTHPPTPGGTTPGRGPNGTSQPVFFMPRRLRPDAGEYGKLRRIFAD
jgi:hypothetical protein